MPTRDKRIDAYIAKSADFAQPILNHLRQIVHEGCPAVEETIKWGFPSFVYKGMLCGMAAFKQHCTFGFWKGKLIIDLKPKAPANAMGHFGRVTSMKDLPSKRVLVEYVRKAAQLNDQGIKVPKKPKPAGERKLVVPPYFMAAVKKNKKATATFEGFPYSKKKDYVEWVMEAKTDETRDRRMQTSVKWMAEGKSRNWKYEKC
jgi:hypothetical protein